MKVNLVIINNKQIYKWDKNFMVWIIYLIFVNEFIFNSIRLLILLNELNESNRLFV